MYYDAVYFFNLFKKPKLNLNYFWKEVNKYLLPAVYKWLSTTAMSIASSIRFNIDWRTLLNIPGVSLIMAHDRMVKNKNIKNYGNWQKTA